MPSEGSTRSCGQIQDSLESVSRRAIADSLVLRLELPQVVSVDLQRLLPRNVELLLLHEVVLDLALLRGGKDRTVVDPAVAQLCRVRRRHVRLKVLHMQHG